MRKRSLAVLLATLLLLSGCAPALPEGVTADQAAAGAQAAVKLFSAGDYATLASCVREDLQTELSAAVLEEAAALVLADAGELIAFRDQAVQGTTDPQTGASCAMVVLVVKYAAKQVVYTIVFDKDLSLIGFYLR